MGFAENAMGRGRPEDLYRSMALPRKGKYLPSPASWRDEVVYFLLVDRFSDGAEQARPLLDRADLAGARPPSPVDGTWRWSSWAESGAARWQGGTLAGVKSKLSYLHDLGISALWLSPVFKQRGHIDSYHGYGIQDFLDVDPHFGDRRDLVDIVEAAHALGVRVILDVIFNHSGSNWHYRADAPGGRSTPTYTTGRYPFGSWRDAEGQSTGEIRNAEDGVWPRDLQREDVYTRAGSGDLGGGDIGDPQAQHKRTDFIDLRDFQLESGTVLADLARCYKYWMALTGCDGFRIDTLKHVSFEEARNFCGSIKEFAANLGMQNFLLMAEIAGGDTFQDAYLDALTLNLDAALDIGETKIALGGVAKGLVEPRTYFARFTPSDPGMGSHRVLGDAHVSVLDDHDHVFGDKVRFSTEAATDHQVAAGVAIQLFTLGIPCIYYGTEQALAGPEPSERQWLPEWKRSDRYLREAMFGPDHPRRPGRVGLQAGTAGIDQHLPGFGPFGTAGRHCFDPDHGVYLRIAAMTDLRGRLPVLRHGRQYQRPISLFGGPFELPAPGELLAWSRILDDEEALCVLNGHGTQARGGRVLIDATLNDHAVMTVVLNTAQAAARGPYRGPHPVRSTLPVRRTADGDAFVEIQDLPPSETLVLLNYPDPSDGAVTG